MIPCIMNIYVDVLLVIHDLVVGISTSSHLTSSDALPPGVR